MTLRAVLVGLSCFLAYAVCAAPPALSLDQPTKFTLPGDPSDTLSDCLLAKDRRSDVRAVHVGSMSGNASIVASQLDVSSTPVWRAVVPPGFSSGAFSCVTPFGSGDVLIGGHFDQQAHVVRFSVDTLVMNTDFGLDGLVSLPRMGEVRQILLAGPQVFYALVLEGAAFSVFGTSFTGSSFWSVSGTPGKGLSLARGPGTALYVGGSSVAPNSLPTIWKFDTSAASMPTTVNPAFWAQGFIVSLLAQDSSLVALGGSGGAARMRAAIFHNETEDTSAGFTAQDGSSAVRIVREPATMQFLVAQQDGTSVKMHALSPSYENWTTIVDEPADVETVVSVSAFDGNIMQCYKGTNGAWKFWLWDINPAMSSLQTTVLSTPTPTSTVPPTVTSSVVLGNASISSSTKVTQGSTVTVQGSLDVASDAVVEVSPASAGVAVFQVAGAATINGGSLVVELPEKPPPNKPVEVPLISAGSLLGSFSGVTANAPDVDSSCESLGATQMPSSATLSAVVTLTSTCSEAGLSPGAIAGIGAAAALVGIFAILLMAHLVRRKRQRFTRVENKRLRDEEMDEVRRRTAQKSQS